MTASTTRSAQIRRAAPRVAQIVLGAAGLASGQQILMLLGMVLVGSAVFTNWRRWWAYVQTGETAGGWTPQPQYAEPGARSVRLIEVGAQPVDVIKAVREIAGADLLGAKILVEGVPSIIAEGVSEASANAALQRLTSMGATARVEAAPRSRETR